VCLQRPLRRLTSIEDGTAPGGSNSLANPTMAQRPISRRSVAFPASLNADNLGLFGGLDAGLVAAAAVCSTASGAAAGATDGRWLRWPHDDDQQLTPLELQAIYDHLAVSGRRDGKPGGLAPQHILAVHRCLHRALAQAVTWRLLNHNPAAHATPPPVPRTEMVAPTPEQVTVLLDAADRTTSPWTILAAATGARNGELCGLQWADLDLEGGTIQFRQTLTIIDPTVLSDATDSDGGAGMAGGRRELAVGPLKSTASHAILTLPPFAVQALRRHRRQQTRLRLALGQSPSLWLRWVEPASHPTRSSSTWSFAPSGAPPSTPTTPAAPSPGGPPAPS
jgi:hypothetical protein